MVLQVLIGCPSRTTGAESKRNLLLLVKRQEPALPRESATSVPCSAIVAEDGSHQFQGGIYGGSIHLQLR